MSTHNKTEAAAHPYLTIREAVEAERAEREAERVAAEHQQQVDGLMRAIVKRAVWA